MVSRSAKASHRASHWTVRHRPAENEASPCRSHQAQQSNFFCPQSQFRRSFVQILFAIQLITQSFCPFVPINYAISPTQRSTMLTIYSTDHHLHHGVELKDGAITSSFEQPLRAETVLARVKTIGLG